MQRSILRILELLAKNGDSRLEANVVLLAAAAPTTVAVRPWGSIYIE